jgi:hypothetical protein
MYMLYAFKFKQQTTRKQESAPTTNTCNRQSSPPSATIATTSRVPVWCIHTPHYTTTSARIPHASDEHSKIAPAPVVCLPSRFASLPGCQFEQVQGHGRWQMADLDARVISRPLAFSPNVAFICCQLSKPTSFLDSASCFW